MMRTVKLKLRVTEEQHLRLCALQKEYACVCGAVAKVALEERVWNRVKLHHLVYYEVRKNHTLGSQLTCQAIRRVCDSYKALSARKGKRPLPLLRFGARSSISFDQRTYTLKKESLSLYTLSGRIRLGFVIAPFQRQYLEQGKPKEARLTRVGNTWYFNLVLEMPSHEVTKESKTCIGVDVGENVLAVTSSGKFFKGAEIRDKRDRYLSLRKRLQSNGSRAAKRKLRQVSGREKRYMKQKNHEIAKRIVEESLRVEADTIVLEELTYIREKIRGNKKVRTRLHRWAFGQLQRYIDYKAEAKGLKVVYMQPAYTSQVCSCCQNLGRRMRHTFVCTSCGSRLHSDRNAAINLSKLTGFAKPVTGAKRKPPACVSLSVG